MGTAVGASARRLLLGVAFLLASVAVSGQPAALPPAGASCVVTAGNRNAPLAADGSYVVFGIPGSLGAIRARAVCSDGSLGQSAAGFTDPLQDAQVELGPIQFGQFTPSPLAGRCELSVRVRGAILFTLMVRRGAWIR